MSIGLDMLSRSADNVLSTFAQTMTFRGVDIQVSRNELGSPDGVNGTAKGQPNFQADNYTEIDVLTGQVASIPLTGEVFTEQNQRKHRVQLVKSLGFAWRCYCRSSGPA